MDNRLMTIDVSHGTTHDGPGMRTTVFVKGCSLHCAWCQNPESISRENEVWWSANDCIGCQTCTAACPNGALRFDDDGLHVDRAACRRCGTCAEACPTSALSWQGQIYDMETLMREVLRDRNYYTQFGGGVTCSGGEPLLQYEFVAEFFRRVRGEGFTTALDTCGFAPRKNLEAVLPWTNYILYDIKLFDEAAHRRFTGASNRQILDNLLFLAEHVRGVDPSKRIWIRTPLIPGITAELHNIEAIGRFIGEHLSDVVERWELCAFNGLCASKYEKLGLDWAFRGMGAMTDAEIEPIRRCAEASFCREKVFISGMIRPTEQSQKQSD